MLGHFPPDTIGGVRKAVLTLLALGRHSLLCGRQMVNQLNLGIQGLGCARRLAAEPRGLHPGDSSALDIWESGMGFKFRSLCQKQP